MQELMRLLEVTIEETTLLINVSVGQMSHFVDTASQIAAEKGEQEFVEALGCSTLSMATYMSSSITSPNSSSKELMASHQNQREAAATTYDIFSSSHGQNAAGSTIAALSEIVSNHTSKGAKLEHCHSFDKLHVTATDKSVEAEGCTVTNSDQRASDDFAIPTFALSEKVACWRRSCIKSSDSFFSPADSQDHPASNTLQLTEQKGEETLLLNSYSADTESEITGDEIYARLGLVKSFVYCDDIKTEFMGFTPEEELINSIHACKARISSPSVSHKERDRLVQILVSLRWSLYNRRNQDEVLIPSAVQVYGHVFYPRKARSKVVVVDHPLHGVRSKNEDLCEACLTRLSSSLKKPLECRLCHILVHKNCASTITSICLGLEGKVCSLNLQICPEVGLSKQAFKCGLCKSSLLHFDGKEESARSSRKHKIEHRARKCDYTGLYYCRQCHTGDLHMIPARILHNWDFNLYPVSRRSYALLELLWSQRLFNISVLSRSMLERHPELVKIQIKRRRLAAIMTYAGNCKQMRSEHILNMFRHEMHLLQDNALYTLEDLACAASGSLLKLLEETENKMIHHIRSNCRECWGRGHFCNVCHSTDTLFPFDAGVVICPACKSVHHKECFDPMFCTTCMRISEYAKD